MKPRIFFLINYQDGTGYYRMSEPAKMIEKLGLAKVVVNPFNPVKPPKDAWTEIKVSRDQDIIISPKITEVLGDPRKPNVDAVVMQRMDTMAMFSLAMGIRAAYQIPVLQENDDYVFDVPNTNPGSLDYRERRQENQTNPDDPFMVARRALGTFDGYIVSTPFLKGFYEKYSPTYLCPNSLDLSRRPLKPRVGHKGIRIMFSSSAGHYDNLLLLKDPITKIFEKYPNVTFYQYKFLPNLWAGTRFAKRVKTMNWTSPDTYWDSIQAISPDICLAPLRDRLFNRGKSNLRLLEYWSSKQAVICSPVGHYTDTVKDGKNALIARNTDQWVENIERLIENPSLRTKIAEGGYATLTKDFNLEKNARNWVSAVRDAIRHYNPDKQPPDRFLPPSQRQGGR